MAPDSKDIPPAKLPPSARQAETAFRDAQASADKVDTLVFVPQRVTAAIKLYDTAEASIRADRFDPAVRAATIAPYLDEKTVAIVHFDPARIDVAAAVDRIAEIWRPTPQETAELMAFVKNSQTQLDTFAKAGGRDIYAVATSESSQAYLIATIREGGDPLAIARALKKDDGFEAAEQVGNVVFAGSKSTLEKLKAARAAPRPELVKAFEAAGDTSAQLVVLPTPEMRQGLSAFSADSAGAKLAADGLQWVAVGLNAPPKLSVLLTIQMKDAASAAALSKLITSLVAALGNHSRCAKGSSQVRRSGQAANARGEGGPPHRDARSGKRKRDAAFGRSGPADSLRPRCCPPGTEHVQLDAAWAGHAQLSP